MKREGWIIFEVQKIMSYVPFAFVVLVLFLSYQVIAPFVTSVVFALILTFIFSPVHKRLTKRIKRKNLAALLITLLIVITLAVPLVYFGNAVIQEANQLYVHTTKSLQENTLLSLECEGDTSFVCDISRSVNALLADKIIGQYITDVTGSVTQFFSDTATKLIVAIPKTMLESVMLFFMVFYFLRDSAKIKKRLDALIPLKKSERKQIYLDVRNVIFGVIYGSIIVALIQGAMGAFGFYIFGVQSPLFWGLIMAILALIPMIGTLLIWGPAAFGIMIQGVAADNSGLVMKGILLIIYGLCFISSVENILKPKIIGDQAKIHPVIILIGVLGGLKAFGLIGFFIGPLALALAITSIQIVERNSTTTKESRK